MVFVHVEFYILDESIKRIQILSTIRVDRRKEALRNQETRNHDILKHYMQQVKREQNRSTRCSKNRKVCVQPDGLLIMEE